MQEVGRHQGAGVLGERVEPASGTAKSTAPGVTDLHPLRISTPRHMHPLCTWSHPEASAEVDSLDRSGASH